MKIIKINLPRELETVEIHTFADEHIGDEHCDLKRLVERIEYVKNTPNAYCILNGDLVDNATKTSIGDTYTQVFNPMEQLAKAVELFEPIKNKVLCITHGNHENRTYKKEGINLSRLIADQLGLSDRYTATSAVLFIRMGEESRHAKETNGSGKYRQICYTMYVLHGSGGGRKEGAKAIRLADMASIIDCDCYIHSHTHLPMIMKQGFHRIDPRNSTVANVTKLFVNTAANLNYGGGYGEAQEFKPTSKDTPIIYLNGRKKNFEARL
jgi:predicted phosphodiesterase